MEWLQRVGVWSCHRPVSTSHAVANARGNGAGGRIPGPAYLLSFRRFRIFSGWGLGRGHMDCWLMRAQQRERRGERLALRWLDGARTLCRQADLTRCECRFENDERITTGAHSEFFRNIDHSSLDRLPGCSGACRRMRFWCRRVSSAGNGRGGEEIREAKAGLPRTITRMCIDSTCGPRGSGGGISWRVLPEPLMNSNW
jgi:hypothetical protein